MARHVHQVTGMKNLCLAGGVALNCVANGRVLREGPFDEVWIQPAAGDAGGALGVALLIWHQLLDNPRPHDQLDYQGGSSLGPEFSNEQVQEFLDSAGAVYQKFDDVNELCHEVAGLIADEQVIGWMQGRMEFGPRALGGRSILGDARSTRMQSVMNLKIKFRESFRPFAPTVLREHVHEYFDLDADSPYMLQVAPIVEKRQIPMDEGQQQLFGIEKLNVPRSDIPAITHVDGSARLQTVTEKSNTRIYRLIQSFKKLSGFPILLNTSFNLPGEPIVESPLDALNSFKNGALEHLCIGDYLVNRQYAGNH